MVYNYEKDCEICKIFSNINRLKILNSMKDKSLAVLEISKKTKLPQPVVSQHLSIMKMKGIVESRKKGAFVYYKIKYKDLIKALNIIEGIRKQIQKNK